MIESKYKHILPPHRRASRRARIALIAFEQDVATIQRYLLERSIKTRLSGRSFQYFARKSLCFLEICLNFSIFVFSYDAKQFRTNFIAIVKHCLAYGCTNRSSKRACKSLSWHLLPSKNKKRHAEWLVKIRRENTPVTKNSYLCSDHFSKECFIKPIGKKRKRLKRGSVPTKFSFIVEKPQRKKPCYQVTNQTTNRIKRINKVNNSNSAACEIKNKSESNEHDSGVDIEQMANVNCHDSRPRTSRA